MTYPGKLKIFKFPEYPAFLPKMSRTTAGRRKKSVNGVRRVKLRLSATTNPGESLMGIMQFFKNLIGGKRPIDQPRGPGVPRPRWYSDMVAAHLERVGLRIEQRKPPRGVQATSNINAVFEQDAERQATDYYRRQSGGVPLVGSERLFTVPPDHLR
jgi:hypothetical protein